MSEREQYIISPVEIMAITLLQEAAQKGACSEEMLERVIAQIGKENPIKAALTGVSNVNNGDKRS